MTAEVINKARSVADDYRKAFGDDLVSVILYGSSVTPEYDPNKSDLNFLIVLSEQGIERLDLAHQLVAKWRRNKVSTPLFLTRDYIEFSLDAFPIEFLNIKRNYELIDGEDVLQGISFKRNFIRLQSERELKGKLLLLRQRYAETRGKRKILKELISSSLPTFVFVFKGLLFLLGKEVPQTKTETLSLLSKELNLDEELFASLLQIQAGTRKPSLQETEDLCKRYLKEIRRLALLMDSDVFGEE